MKYLNKLFAFDDRQTQQQSSAATLTSNLYSVTFISESNNCRNQHRNHLRDQQEEDEGNIKELQLSPSSSTSSSSSSSSYAKVAFRRNQIPSDQVESTTWKQALIDDRIEPRTTIGGHRQRQEVKLAAIAEDETRREEENPGIIGYLLAATIGKALIKQYNLTTKASQKQTDRLTITKDHTSQIDDRLEKTEDDDWIFVEENNFEIDHHLCPDTNRRNKIFNTTKTNTHSTKNNIINSSINKKPLTQLKKMALDKADIELIKASWVPVRKDPTASGVLLFKGLFIKFPQYLKYFPQFANIDLDRMHENKRLLKHAIGVIETVTFVVDAIGDESKSSQLNDALVKLVKSHLRRKIGLPEFRNLGIVLIDFICDVVGRGGPTSINTDDQSQQQLNKSSTSESINTNSSSMDSETMTSALDKLRASSSPSSSSEEESYLSPNLGVMGSQTVAAGNNLNDISSSSGSNFAKLEGNNTNADDCANNKQREARQPLNSCGSESSTATTTSTSTSSSSSQSSHTNNNNNNSSSNKEAKIETNLHLVAAWTKLYNIILDLVKREEANSAAAAVAVGE